jgi:hypothetical protein
VVSERRQQVVEERNRRARRRPTTEIPGVVAWKLIAETAEQRARLVCLVPLLFGGQITVAWVRKPECREAFEDTIASWDEAWDFDDWGLALGAFLAFDGTQPDLAIRHQHDGKIDKLRGPTRARA